MYKNSGLKITPSDPHDFHYYKTFGAVARVVLPDEYFAGKPKVKDQGLSEMCTAFASYVLGACEDNMDFCPEYSFAAGKTISKTALDAPEDLRTPVKTAVAVGYLPSYAGLTLGFNRIASLLRKYCQLPGRERPDSGEI